jgi:hemoglobin
MFAKINRDAAPAGVGFAAITLKPERPAANPKHIYKARRRLNHISVLLKSCYRHILTWDRPSFGERRSRGQGMAMSTENAASSLYDRLGGVYAIASVVDDFIDRIMIDPALNSNPLVDEAHHRVGKAGFKYLVTEMVGWATGGPQKYTGRSMADSHVNLKITELEWIAFCKDFQDTLDKFSVPAREQGELFAIVQSTKSDIVSAAAVA